MGVLSYLRFALGDHADLEAFAHDIEAMRKLAADQPGHRWTEVGRDPQDERRWFVVSEWDEVEQIRAWERVEEHSGVMDRWEAAYGEPLVHRRFVPWARPQG